MTSDPRMFTKRCNIVYIVLTLGCAAGFIVSFLGGDANLLGFPVVFFLAAIMNFFTAWLRFRKNIRGQNQKAAGFLALTGGILLLVICYISILNIW